MGQVNIGFGPRVKMDPKTQHRIITTSRGWPPPSGTCTLVELTPMVFVSGIIMAITTALSVLVLILF